MDLLIVLKNHGTIDIDNKGGLSSNNSKDTDNEEMSKEKIYKFNRHVSYSIIISIVHVIEN